MTSETIAGPDGRAPEPDIPAPGPPPTPENPEPDLAPAPGVAYYLRRYFGPFLIFLLFLRGASTLAWLGVLIPIQLDLTFPEGAVVARALDAAEGRPVYQDWRQWPHAFAPYGPLTYYPVGWVARLIKTHPHPLEIYSIGRVQSMICILVLCAGLAWITRRAGMGVWWAFIVPCLFLSWDQPISFIISYRPDAPAVMFSILALGFMLAGPPTIRRMIPVFVSLSLAMWFKTTAWGMIFTAAWWIARERGWLRAAGPLAVFGGANLLIALGLNHAMEGRLLLNLVDSLDNGIDLTNCLAFYLNLDPEELTLDPLPVSKVIFIVAILYAMRRLAKGGARGPNGALWVAMIATWLTASFLGLKEGADINYFVEAYAVSTVVAAAFAWSLWTQAASVRPRWREGLLLGVILPLFILENNYALSSIRRDLTTVKKMWGGWAFSSKVVEIPGEVLVWSPFLAMYRPAPPTMMDYIQYAILTERGKIDPKILREKIQREDFDAIIFASNDVEIKHPNWLEEATVAAIHQHYDVTDRIGNVVFLRPKRILRNMVRGPGPG